MFPIIPILILLSCVDFIWGISIIVDQGSTNTTIAKRVFEFERCILDTFHIDFLGPHTDPDRKGNPLPVATQCGHPQGSTHINLHIDECIAGKTPPCNNCQFPFTTYSQWTKLRKEYLIFLYNWHGFIYKRGSSPCVCLWDSQTKDQFDICVGTDISEAVTAVVKGVLGIAQAIWNNLSKNPLQVKVAVMAVVLAALVLFLPAILEALAAGGVVGITTAVITDAVADLTAGATAAFGL